MRPHLYKRPCPLVVWSVGQSVRTAFVKINEKWTFMDSKWLTVLGEEKRRMRKEGQGRRRDKEEGGTGLKEGSGEWKNEKDVKKLKNEKVAKGRIIGLAGPCYGKKSHNFIRCMRTYLAKQNITLKCVCLEQDANIFFLQIDIFSSKQWVQQYGTSKGFFSNNGET